MLSLLIDARKLLKRALKESPNDEDLDMIHEQLDALRDLVQDLDDALEPDWDAF